MFDVIFQIIMFLLSRSSPPSTYLGRSAAIFSEVYGSPTTRSLSKATKAFLYSPKEMGMLALLLISPKDYVKVIILSLSEHSLVKLAKSSLTYLPMTWLLL